MYLQSRASCCREYQSVKPLLALIISSSSHDALQRKFMTRNSRFFEWLSFVEDEEKNAPERRETVNFQYIQRAELAIN